MNPKLGYPKFVTCFLDLASCLNINMDDMTTGACTPSDKKSFKSRINTGESVKISDIIERKTTHNNEIVIQNQQNLSALSHNFQKKDSKMSMMAADKLLADDKSMAEETRANTKL